MLVTGGTKKNQYTRNLVLSTLISKTICSIWKREDGDSAKQVLRQRPIPHSTCRGRHSQSSRASLAKPKRRVGSRCGFPRAAVFPLTKWAMADINRASCHGLKGTGSGWQARLCSKGNSAWCTYFNKQKAIPGLLLHGDSL